MRAIVRRTEQTTVSARHEETDETFFPFEVHLGRLTAEEVVTDFPIRRAAEFHPRLSDHKDRIAPPARKARHRLFDARKQADHPDHWRGIHRTGRALIVERDVAAGHRRVEDTTRVRNPSRGFLKLIEDLGP